jgi:aspartate carbamoyltransferase catalytic subunit
MTIDFKGKDILNGFQFSNQELNVIMETASYYEMRVKRGEIIKDLEGLVVATLFFEPSTRTRLSFEAAINRLGARVVSMAEPANSSIAKGESLEDTILTVDGYCDCIVMRHPVSGSAARAAEVAVHPVINGGDGTSQHPTQALLDIYTIRKEKGHIGGQTITFLGDLKYGRTVHSLGYLMQQFNNKMIFVSPESLRMPEEITAELKSRGADIEETDDIKYALSQSDIVYVTRVQRERFPSVEEYEKCKGSYILNNDLLKYAKPGITIMHPLPRVDEIATELDTYEGSAYFRQASNGMYLRMALLGLVTGRHNICYSI